jgi:transcriptional regulator with XRE-family HTH domain
MEKQRRAGGEPVKTRIRELRKKRRMKVSELAHLCGVQPGTLRRWETGEREIGLGMAVKIALILGVGVGELVVPV